MKYRIVITEQAREAVEGLSFRQLLNQVCCPTYGRIGEQRLEEFGAMFFHPMEREKLETVIRQFQACCTIPPLIVSDLECGPGNMILGATKFPYMMGLSQTNSEELAYEVGKIAAMEAGELGYNWTFSPVADLADDPDSPVVGMRSPGVKPEHAIKMAGAYLQGLQDHGMIGTIKHFPGDGWSSLDHHLTTPVIRLGADAWRSGPGRVFRELIERGAITVMPGHIALPAFDEPDERGLYPPATVSRRLLFDLLRGELGFEGLIVSDAVEMGGAVGFMNYYDLCADALENGCDMLLFPRMDERFYREMEQRLNSGRLSMITLRERASRIVALKEQFGLYRSEPPHARTKPVPFNRMASEQVAERVVDESITLVRDRQGLLPFPIRNETKVLHVVIMNNHDRYGELLERMKREIGRYTDRVDQWVDPGPDRLFQAAADQTYDLIICSIGSRLSYGLNVVRLHDEVARNMMGGWTKLATPILFVAHYHPFVHKEYEASIDTIINTYGDIEYTAGRLLQAVTGERPIKRELYAHD
ncbi:beta-N-acetylhexosaminidase [Paenibacillus sp. UNCCL117]|uniref:glycoside hydrolase family 3 protein n=1 Tax=unclassified Paenibacillus TaxID=185978 RepID=UPI00087F1FAD|nr:MULTISPECIES: glycoside hydrolase family 3 N-terminal domain-containing protein [unclassified Paenibacillus]SDE26433.1 beta-N-acetylhexosaminidase [Paenibacillus sp. cl123]SFW62625.1 beta-N-acetylhexosaminidase [Paenibacillus sp. UNCCL117]